MVKPTGEYNRVLHVAGGKVEEAFVRWRGAMEAMSFSLGRWSVDGRSIAPVRVKKIERPFNFAVQAS